MPQVLGFLTAFVFLIGGAFAIGLLGTLWVAYVAQIILGWYLPEYTPSFATIVGVALLIRLTTAQYIKDPDNKVVIYAFTMPLGFLIGAWLLTFFVL